MGVAIKQPETGKKRIYIRKATGDVTVVHIPAAEGEPSTFWKSDSGKYYRTKAEAQQDKGNAVNPEDYRIEVGFFTKYKTYILGAFCAAVVAALVIWGAPKLAAKFGK